VTRDLSFTESFPNAQVYQKYKISFIVKRSVISPYLASTSIKLEALKIYQLSIFSPLVFNYE
jgi:hypothetical protein